MTAQLNASALANSAERTPLESDIITLLMTSRNALTRNEAQRDLLQAKILCASATIRENGRLPSLRLEVLSDLAADADTVDQRDAFWKDGIEGGFRHLQVCEDPDFAAQLFRKVVDYTQDPYISKSSNDINSLLHRARKGVDLLLTKTDTLHAARLLSCKASILRRMSRFQTTRNQEIHFSEQAVRCAEKACKTSANLWYTHLELANCYWHAAQFEKGDEHFNRMLEETERNLWNSIELEKNENNTQALARYYRNTYQSMPFVLAYEQYASVEKSKPEYYRTSYLWAEGVLQLYYGEYPATSVEAYLRDADGVLERTIDSGYGDARHIVALGFIKAAQGDATAGMEVIKLLHQTDGKLSWTELAERITTLKSDRKSLAQGFSLGITQSGVWNKLGTYARKFLKNMELATTMYRVALQLNPSNAVAMTNLATSLLQEGTLASIQEANRWISKAASCADRRFRWWRSVRDEINSALASIEVDSNNVHTQTSSRLHNFADLRRAYQALELTEDKQARGYELEKLIARLIKLSLGNCRPSYRSKQTWADNTISQIDAAFCHLDSHYFRVEAKWTTTAITPDKVALFRDKLDVTGVSGLFISINGFTPEAVAKAATYRADREILLMDGEELRAILNGCPSFDEAIRCKRQYFSIESNPYHRVQPVLQDDND